MEHTGDPFGHEHDTTEGAPTQWQKGRARLVLPAGCCPAIQCAVGQVPLTMKKLTRYPHNVAHLQGVWVDASLQNVLRWR